MQLSMLKQLQNKTQPERKLKKTTLLSYASDTLKKKG